MVTSVETVSSNSCWQVHCTLDTEADRPHENRQAFTAMPRHLLQGKKYLYVLYLMLNLQDGTNDLEFAACCRSRLLKTLAGNSSCERNW